MKKQFYALAVLLIISSAAKAQVGIGTATPDATAMLDIVSSAKGLLMPRMTTVQRTGITTPAAGLQVYDTTTNTLWYFNGTIWVNTGAPAASVNIYNADGALTGNRTVTMGPSTLTFNGTGTGVGIRVNTATGSTGFSQSSTGRFDVDATNVAGGRLTVLESGNIGIGNNAPATKLDVTGQAIQVSNVGSASFVKVTNGTNDIRLQQNNGSGLVGTLSNNDFQVYTNGLARITALAGGNVGVNQASPTNQLHVTGTTTPIRIDATNTSGQMESQIQYYRAASGNSWYAGYGTNGVDGFGFYGTPGSLLNLLNNGNVGIGTTTPSTKLEVNGVITATKIQGPSDQRFKKNIKPIENALGKIMKLGGYTYDWRDASEFPKQTLGKGHDMGVIAQEVEKQFPEAVTTNADGYKAVSYTILVPALIEAIKAQQIQMQEATKTQQVQIDELKKEIIKLKK